MRATDESQDAPPAGHETAIDEATLVARAQDGDIEAFGELVRRWNARLYRYAYTMLGNRQDAEDVLQDTLVRIWRFLPRLDAPAAFSGWAYRTLTRQCYALLAKRRTQQTDPFPPNDVGTMADRHPDGALVGALPRDPADQVEAGHRLNDLTRLVQILPPEQRACWLLREVQGHSYRQIASVLGITEAAVRGRLARARERLAEGMTSWQ